MLEWPPRKQAVFLEEPLESKAVFYKLALERKAVFYKLVPRIRQYNLTRSFLHGTRFNVWYSIK